MMLPSVSFARTAAFRFLLMICLIAAGPAAADTIWFKNGDRLTGEVKSLDGGKLVVQSPYGGVMSLDWSAVSTLESEKELILRDGTLGKEYQVMLHKATPGQILVTSTQRVLVSVKSKCKP